MNIQKLFLLLFLAAGLAGPSTAQVTYHVSPNGDDGNNGLSPASAWRTVARVNRANLKPGSRVLFKRGGIWKETLSPPSSGLSSARIVFGAYGSGTRPLITGRDHVAGANVATNWLSRGGSRWEFVRPVTDPYRLFFDGREYGSAPSAQKVNARYRWHWDGDWGGYGRTHRLTIYAPANPAYSYLRLERANNERLALGGPRGRSYLTFREIEFAGGVKTIELANWDHILFDRCAIGASAGYYGIWIEQGSDDGEIRDCIIDREDTVAYDFDWLDPRTGGQDCIMIRGGNGWDIHHNVVRGMGHDGVNLCAAEDGSTTVNNNRIHHNEFALVGKADYGRAFETQGAKNDATRCQFNEFFNNYVHNTTEPIQVLGHKNRFYYNVIDTVRLRAWSAHGYVCNAFSFDGYRASGGNEVLNNTIRHVDGPGISLRAGPTGAVIRNNILYDCGRKGGAGGDGLQDIALVVWAGAAPFTCQNNALFSPAGRLTVVLRQDGWGRTAPMSVSSFNLMNGRFGDRIGGNISDDPLLWDDLHLRPGSPCSGAGMDVGLSYDFNDTPLRRGKRPDIGALPVRKTRRGH